MPRKVAAPKRHLEIVTLTPERAIELLEHNTLNRPLSQPHVNRIIEQIKSGKWKWNGDTIKIAEGGDVVDGQHRLWAIAEAKHPVETVVVYGVPREAFATVDTLRKPRSGADILALNGLTEFRRETSLALSWLIRWQRGTLRGSASRVENSDIEQIYASHPSMVRAVERASRAVKGFASPGLFGFLFYVITNRDSDTADRMIDTLADPAGVAANDPFFRLRSYLTTARGRYREPILTMALTIKAANLAKAGKRCEILNWKNHGERAEAFPQLAF
jgi:hypothetical protein